MKLDCIGILGAGVMGTAVAHAASDAGIAVVLVDDAAPALRRANHRVADVMRVQRLFGQRAPAAATAGRITVTRDVDAVHAVDFVIENVTEQWEIKQRLYRRLDRICRPSCIFGVNTSTISIGRIAAVTRRPAQIVGLHFMNPVALIPLVEVIRGDATSDATLAIARQLLAQLGKDAIVVRDKPGFVTNRVAMLAINEAIAVLEDEVAAAADIDEIFRRGFNHRMGPLETADLIGLDTVMFSLERLQESYNDVKYTPCRLLRRMVDAGLLGRKSGRGFYEYGSHSQHDVKAEQYAQRV